MSTIATHHQTLCIGNFAIDNILFPAYSVSVPGGAALRFVSAWAMLGPAISALGVVGHEPMWDATFEVLNENGVDLAQMHRTDTSLQFSTYFDDDLEIVGFDIDKPQLMTFLAGLGRNSDLQRYDVIHVCPFAPADQYDLVKRAKRLGKTVSSMIHYSSLTQDSRRTYLELLSHIDYLFLNLEEAQFLVGSQGNWLDCGQALSEAVCELTFLTLGQDGSAVFANGQFLVSSPPARLGVKDALGAGDCFAGGALAGLLLTGDPLRALRYGSIAAAFALADVGHQALLQFIETR